ncbi:putative flavin-containing monooxygenase 1 [Hibiscus syriacus]|uniref:Flavin-containing monooxygenase 1 n=1 Tax=Hibiscus syriacus TaxID=106335 RepID=A0A6A2ZDC3_HIBSY|nr:putative flavin-containing monooxygenase 1 [Hibiscus syriacus]
MVTHRAFHLWNRSNESLGGGYKSHPTCKKERTATESNGEQQKNRRRENKKERDTNSNQQPDQNRNQERKESLPRKPPVIEDATGRPNYLKYPKEKSGHRVWWPAVETDTGVRCPATAGNSLGSDGQPCTMVIMTLHWTVPCYWIWGLPFSMFYSTRSSQFLYHRPNQGLLRNLLCPLLSPLRKAISKFIESYLVWKLPLVKYGLKPDHPFEEDYASCQMVILPDNFFPEADKGKIMFKNTTRWWFWTKGHEFKDNTKLEADVVLLATGFDGKKKIQYLLPQPFLSLVVDSSGIVPLYRGTIQPLIPNMALADEPFELPSIEKMLEQAGEEMEIMKKMTRFYKRHCISTFSINHCDEICEEMGCKSWRKNTWLLEAFAPYNSQDYGEDE